MHISSTIMSYGERTKSEQTRAACNFSKACSLFSNYFKNGDHLKLRIRHKLFLTILLSSSIVACGFYVFLQWNFDRGFLNYVNNQVLADMEFLESRLKDLYSEDSGWENLKYDREIWVELHREMMDSQGGARSVAGEVSSRPPSQTSRPPSQPSRPPSQLSRPASQLSRPPSQLPMDADFLSTRSVLLDSDKQHIIGGPPHDEDAPILRPILSGDKTIGYLGLFSGKEFMDSGDLLFVEQQTEAFGFIALAMLGVSILLTFPVTIHLLRPIKHLTRGTGELIGGQYDTRIPVITGDELGRLSEDFNILAMTLEKNEMARQRWIADISHELRTPLAVLRCEVEALQDGIRKAGPDTVDPLHGEILHLQRLVNDLYELSMSDIGALTYKKVAVNPLGILEGAIELSAKRFSDKGLDLRFEPPAGGLAQLLGDPDRLQQLFTNILENSLRYTDAPGSMVITAETSESVIAITFADSYPGVAEVQLPLLFERLYRTDPSRKRNGSGAGLGLAICTNIIEAHQGTITASNSDLGGLRIDITLPLNS